MLPGKPAGEQCCRVSILLLVLLGFVGTLTAQKWTSLSIEPVGCVMHAVKMRSESIGVAVGDSGVIRWSSFYADDAGQRSLLWSSRRWKNAVRFNDVVLLDGSGYVAVGEQGTVVRAPHESGSPSEVTVATSEHLHCIDRRNAMIVIGGANGLIMRSTNNGATFQVVTMPTTADVVDLCVDGNGRWTAITPTEVFSSMDGAVWTLVHQDENIRQRQITSQIRQFDQTWLLYRVGDDWLSHVSTDGGVTWIDYFGPSSGLQQSDPDAQALSVSASADGLQHSIMYMRKDGTSIKIYHYVSFDAGLSWSDQCTLLFTDFVGESQVMVNDSTLIATSLSGQMLTFSRRGIGIQQWWRAPESVNIPFEPLYSHATANGSIVASRDRAIELSLDDERIARWTFATSANRITDVRAFEDQTYIAVDHRTYDPNFNEINTTHLYQRNHTDTFAVTYAHTEPYGGATIDQDSTGTLILSPYGKSVIWSDDRGATYQRRPFSDTSWWSTSNSILVGGDMVWSQVLQLSEPQAPFGIISTDGGSTWTKQGEAPFHAVSGVAVGEELFLAALERVGLTKVRVRIARSLNKGETWWTMVDFTIPGEIYNSVPFSLRGERLACVTPSALFTTDDRGHAWSIRETPTLATGDGLTTGHWISDSTLVAYSKSGMVHTAHIPRKITSVTDHVNDPTEAYDVVNEDRLLIRDHVASVVAYDLTGRAILLTPSTMGEETLVELENLPRGMWMITYMNNAGEVRCRVTMPGK